MNAPKFWNRINPKSLFALSVTMLVAIATVVYFLPRQNKIGYQYELGKPWKYAPLIASYDFPIYKTSEEIAAERDSVMKGFQPFYEKDPMTEARQVKALRDAFYQGKIKNIPAYYLPHLVEMLNHVYKAGILTPEDYSALLEKKAEGIRIVSGQAASGRAMSEVFSTRSAYEYIMHADTVHYSRELLMRCNINDYLVPDLQLDSAKTNQQREDLLATVSPASGMVQSGQRIIDRGEIIKESQLQILASFERENLRRNDPSKGVWQILAGQTIFVTTILVLFVIYLRLFRREILDSPHSIYLLSTLIVFFPVATSVTVSHDFANVYVIPYAMVPIFVRIFMDSRTAFMALVCTVLLSSFPIHSPYQFALVQLAGGLTAIYSLKDLTERAQLFRTAFIVTAVMMLFGLAFDLAQGIGFSDMDISWYIHICVNGVALLFAYPLMYLIERLFGFTSSVSLVELTNINHPILRKMSKVAQGTFNHSMQVANLAAEVANKIGAKPQLARTGALYHDIGKMLNPAFFTENQSGVNPHDSLSEERSAQIIISHVTEGIRLTEKYHLPKVIRDFIVTHHGRSKVKFFYIQYANNHPGETINEELFTYPGPNPFTREQAILMMCDAVEATSRSLKEITEESIRELVDRIIDGQMKEGYFRDCPLTFRDVSDAKNVLVESLKTIYHTRIAYPELKTGQQQEESHPSRNGFFGTGLHRTWNR